MRVISVAPKWPGLSFAQAASAAGLGIAATKLSITTQPASSASSGVPFSVQPVLQLRSANNTAVQRAGAVVTCAVNSGGDTLGGVATAITNSLGVATYIDLQLTGSNTDTLIFTSPGLTSVVSGSIAVSGGGFITPDLINNFGFEVSDGGSGWGTGLYRFTDWTGANPPDGPSIDTSIFYAGAQSMGWDIPAVPGPDDGGTNTLTKIPTQNNRVWTRFYFKLTCTITHATGGIWKFHRFYDNNFSIAEGGIFLGDTFKWIYDAEGVVGVDFPGVTGAMLTDGNWHWVEVDYWRVGDPSGFPSVALWFDGVQRFEADGPVAGQSPSFWSGGRYNAGSRGPGTNLGYIEWIGTLNDVNTNTGRVNIDNYSASSLGRIGP